MGLVVCTSFCNETRKARGVVAGVGGTSRALWVLGETGKELRSIHRLNLSVVTASPISRDLETFLQTEFWRLIRKHGCKTSVVTVKQYLPVSSSQSTVCI